MDGNTHDTPPILPVPRPQDIVRFASLEKEMPVAKAAVEARKEKAKPDFEAWIKQATPGSIAASLPQDSPLVELPLSEAQGSFRAGEGDWEAERSATDCCNNLAGRAEPYACVATGRQSWRTCQQWRL